MIRTRLALLAVAGLLATAGTAAGTSTATATGRPTVSAPLERRASARLPFGVGERLSYQAKVNFLNAGSASMSVEDVETVRGHTTFHTIFDVRGKVLFFHVNDHYESWFDTTSLISLHHTQNIEEGSRKDERNYDFYPDRKVYVRNGQEFPSVADPLDEGSFIYFMRTLKLDVGKTYEFNRYYHLDRNPVIIKVVRREHIHVPAGDFDAIVLQPIIKSRGLFSEGGQAEVWFADDSAHTLLRLKSKLPFGTLYLELKQAEYASRR
jgi:hypothetical protein